MSPIFSKIFSLGFLLYTLAAVSALPHAEQKDNDNNEGKDKDDNNKCNADNALRCFRQSSVQASAYCSSYIHIPVVTSTVATITPTTTTTATITDLTTTTSTVTAPIVQPTAIVLRRGDDSPQKDCPAEPNKGVNHEGSGPGCAAEYPAARISSACSCLSVKPSTTSVTATAKAVTSTITTTVTKTVVVFVPSPTPAPVVPPRCTVLERGQRCENNAQCCSGACNYNGNSGTCL